MAVEKCRPPLFAPDVTDVWTRVWRRFGNPPGARERSAPYLFSPICACDASLPQAQLLRRSLSPNRRGRRFAFRAWTARPLAAGDSPAGRASSAHSPLCRPTGRAHTTLSTLCSLAPHQPHSTLRPSHFRQEHEKPPPPPFLARELLPGETSRHRPPPPIHSDPELPLGDTKPPRSSLVKSEPPPSRAPSSLTRHQASPTSSSSMPTTPTAERLLLDVHVDEPSLRKPPHLPLLFPCSYD